MGANNGTSWTDAFTSLQGALRVVEVDESDGALSYAYEIWVAEGTYSPGTNTTDAFQMHLWTETTVGSRAGRLSEISVTPLNTTRNSPAISHISTIFTSSITPLARIWTKPQCSTV